MCRNINRFPSMSVDRWFNYRIKWTSPFVECSLTFSFQAVWRFISKLFRHQRLKVCISCFLNKFLFRTFIWGLLRLIPMICFLKLLFKSKIPKVNILTSFWHTNIFLFQIFYIDFLLIRLDTSWHNLFDFTEKRLEVVAFQSLFLFTAEIRRLLAIRHQRVNQIFETVVEVVVIDVA